MDIGFLRDIGLSPGEITVYSAMLEAGSASANTLHEKTGIERRNVYDILNKLIERGLCSYITENKKRTFKATHPSAILNYIDDKKTSLDKLRDEAEAKIPALTELYNETKPSINAQVFRGKEGIKAVWADMLTTRDIWWIAAGRFVPKEMPVFFHHWNKKRLKLSIKWKSLLINEMRKEIDKPMELERIRFLPKEFSGNPAVIGIYGDKVVNIQYGQEPFAFVIESKELAENYRRYHTYLWENVAEE
ncbi:MAG: helix-turn-helix domain-containing protein [Nanoarchaeota archaeon]